jgi:integrin beta 2
VFFTDYGQIPKVERCDMDGQNRTKLVDSKIVFPHGITLDLVSRLVYWADAYLDYIEVVDYEGKNRHTIIQGLLVRTRTRAHTRTSRARTDTRSFRACL